MLRGDNEDSLPNKFAEALVEKDFDSYKNDLVFLLHEEGINVRYLGIVYEVHNIHTFTHFFSYTNCVLFCVFACV